MSLSEDLSQDDASSKDDVIDPLNGIDNAQSENNANELFQGDKGELRLDTRRVLVQLLSGPFLDSRRHSKLWPVLLRDETIVRRALPIYSLNWI